MRLDSRVDGSQLGRRRWIDADEPCRVQRFVAGGTGPMRQLSELSPDLDQLLLRRAVLALDCSDRTSNFHDLRLTTVKISERVTRAGE